MVKQFITRSIPVLLVLFMTSCAVFSTSTDKQQEGGDSKAKKAKEDLSGDMKPYSEVITTEAKTDSGLFNVHQVKNDVFFEVPDSMLNRDMLIVSRRAAMSSSDLESMVAGERATNPLMVRWEKSPDEQHILLRKVTSRKQSRFTGKDKAFKNSVELQTLDPILLSFPIKAKGQEKASSVIDIQKLFVADVAELTPFGSGGILEALGVIPPKNYIFQDDRSHIKSAKSFDENIEVRSMLTFTEGKHTDTYSILMHRSMVLLPETPMKPRIADERVGNFSVDFWEFDESNPVQMNHYVKRWRLEVAEEDVEKFKNGELVEPKNQIVFYLDSATPEKWRSYVKEGVEDWLPAFEEAGFKNAIEAREIPENDPDFHPEDINHSVIRYAASDIPNAQGPSVMDPRTGEILESDVIMHHNVIRLIRDWRFSQTAANDKEVQTTDIPDDIIGRGLRFVVAHEVGHALGLRHNMGASKAFPVDSLRSASFTQKYGNTPSIMDYARFNYVAQPEDEGVRVNPPALGEYDRYAVKWAYKPIPDAKNAFEEQETLNRWIEEHAGDPNYYFGEGDINSSDPTSLRESLGNDIVKASEYGVKNTKFILDHFDEWLAEEGEDYRDMENMYAATLSQYNRYIGHVGSVIAGVYQRRPRQGDGVKTYSYVPEDKQKEAVQFLLDQYKELPEWLENKELKSKLNIVSNSGMVRRIITPANYIERFYYRSFRRDLINDGKIVFLQDNKLTNPADAYTPEELLADIREGVFGEVVNKEKVGYYEQLLQNVYVDWLLGNSHIDDILSPQNTLSERTQRSLFDNHSAFCEMDFPSELLKLKGTPVYHDAVEIYAEQNNLYFQFMDLSRFDKQALIESLVLAEIKEVRDVLEDALQQTGNDELEDHYSYLLRRLNVFLNSGS